MTDSSKIINKNNGQQGQSRIAQIIDSSDSERQRLARELHDGLGQSMIAIKLKLESLEHNNNPKTLKGIDEIRKMLNLSIDEIRRISNNLMPAVLIEFGLINAVNNLCKELSEHSCINISFESDNVPLNLDKKKITYLYRIVQEALSNIIKHSNARSANVFLSCNDSNIVLTVKDNGQGIDFEEIKNKKGMGLNNIKARAMLLGGDALIKSLKDRGTEVLINIPVNK